MKNLFILLVMTLFVVSCSTESKDNSVGMSLKEYAKSDKFIDIDVAGLRQIDVRDTSVDNQKKVFKINAAYYRIYNKSEFVDGVLQINIKDGNSINISEPLFNELKSILDETNSLILETKTKGTYKKLRQDGAFFKDKEAEEIFLLR